jgi:nitrite reductase (NADH) small subunit
MKWIRITRAENVPQREGRVLTLGSRPVALFNLGDRFVALENRCPHNGGPLADGIVGGTSVTCPLHNWKICLDSGQVTKPCNPGTASVETFPVKVEDGIIFLGIEEASVAA